MGIIDSGVLIANDDVDAIIRKVSPNIVLLIEPGGPEQLDRAQAILAKQEPVAGVELQAPLLRVTLKPGVEDYSPLATELVKQGVALRRFAPEEINLESAFMAFTKGAGSKI